MRLGEIDFKDIPNSSIENGGVYSWHISIPKETNKINRRSHLEKIINLFRKEIRLYGDYYLEKYEGQLNSEDTIALDNNNFDFDNDVFYEFLRTAFSHFAPPLYIGKTRVGISARLKRHYDIFNKVNVSNLDDEDKRFQSQFMSRLNDKNIDGSWLRVKYVIIEQNNHDLELGVEYLINRIYKPLLGKN